MRGDPRAKAPPNLVKLSTYASEIPRPYSLLIAMTPDRLKVRLSKAKDAATTAWSASEGAVRANQPPVRLGSLKIGLVQEGEISNARPDWATGRTEAHI